jgi:hypothetical protein
MRRTHYLPFTGPMELTDRGTDRVTKETLMPDETTAALQEIAGLLRRRVEQQDEQAKKAEARRPGLDQMRERSDRQNATFRELAEERQQKQETLQEEDRQFKQRLIAEMERHNLLLERLLSRMD